MFRLIVLSAYTHRGHSHLCALALLLSPTLPGCLWLWESSPLARILTPAPAPPHPSSWPLLKAPFSELLWKFNSATPLCPFPFILSHVLIFSFL